jgi:hypothetical protein
MMQSLRSAATLMIAAVALAACGDQLGSRYVKTQKVEASKGAIFTVTADDSPEHAGEPELPAGALSSDVVLTVEFGLTSVLGAELSGGPAVVFGPPGVTLSKEALLVLPLRNTVGSDDIGIVGQTDTGIYEVDSNQVALNASRTLASFRVLHLGGYQVRRRTSCGPTAGVQDAGSAMDPATGGGAGTTSSCGNGLSCVNGHCRVPSPWDGGTITTCPLSCPSGTTCDPTLEACVALPTACMSTNDCPSNFACINGACQTHTTSGCDMSNPCGAGQYCITGTCVTFPSDGGSSNPNACMADADCAMGESCINGACRGICTAHTEVCNGVDDDCNGVVDEGCNLPDGGPDAGTECGGFAGLMCSSGQTCIDNPADQCDPLDGGADCMGLCVVDAVDGGIDAGPVDAGPMDPIDAGMPSLCRTSMDCQVGAACVNGVCR